MWFEPWGDALLVPLVVTVYAIAFRVQEGISLFERLRETEGLLALAMLVLIVVLTFYFSPPRLAVLRTSLAGYHSTLFGLLPSLAFCLITMPDLLPSEAPTLSKLRATQIVGWLVLACIFLAAVGRYIYASLST